MNLSYHSSGMRNVKRELKQYPFKDIINAFENLDFSNKIFIDEYFKYAEGLKKIYSLITGQYTVYHNQYDFNVFEKKLQKKFPNNDLIDSIIMSNYKTYFENWNKKQKLEQEHQKKIQKQIKKEKEILKICNQHDHNLRNSQYRQDLIKKLQKFDMKKRIEYIANDTQHGIKFYPSILIVEAKNSFDIFDINILKKLHKKLNIVKKQGPWRRFKQELNAYLRKI